MLLEELSVGKHAAKVGRNEAIQQGSSPARQKSAGAVSRRVVGAKPLVRAFSEGQSNRV